MPKIEIGHGSGGKLTKELIDQVFLRHLACDELRPLEDAASLSIKEPLVAFSTDSYVVSPLFFPGGNIGKLSICGTVNDLVVKGATPKYIALGLIIEEGLTFESLERILQSIGEAANDAGVKVVTGDTKVVEKGKCDGIYINTTGIGEIRRQMPVDDVSYEDAIILTGSIGDHGTAIALARHGFSIETSVESDCASLNELLLPLIENKGIKWMRDPTRGGVATVLAELTNMRGTGIQIDEEKIPVRDDVQFIADMLGYDPLYLANEGKAVIIASPESASEVIDYLRSNSLGSGAAVIGNVTSRFHGVRIKTKIGGERTLDILEEELLPRIC